MPHSRISTLYLYTVFIMHQPTTVAGKPEFYCSRYDRYIDPKNTDSRSDENCCLKKETSQAGFPFLSTCGSYTRLKVLRSEHPGQYYQTMAPAIAIQYGAMDGCIVVSNNGCRLAYSSMYNN